MIMAHDTTGKGETVPMPVMKACRGHGGIAP
jgi:hypothetical protein